MTIASTGVHVIAQKKAEKQSAEPELSLRVAWQSFADKRPSWPAGPRLLPGRWSCIIRNPTSNVSIQRSSRSAKARVLSSEAHSLPEILRAVGGYVDQKGGQVLAVKKENQDVTIEYQSALKKKIVEQFTVASLYDYWVKMYMRRKQRS